MKALMLCKREVARWQKKKTWIKKCHIGFSWFGHCDKLSGFAWTGSRNHWSYLYRCDGDCLFAQYDNDRISFRVECIDAEYNRWFGTVYTGKYGTVSNIDFYGWRIFIM